MLAAEILAPQDFPDWRFRQRVAELDVARHLVAGEVGARRRADLVRVEDRALVRDDDVLADAGRLQVGAGVDREHAGHRQRSGGVDALGQDRDGAKTLLNQLNGGTRALRVAFQ